MTLFVNTPNKMSEEQADKLLAAGISFMCNKAFSAAYSCFELIPLKTSSCCTIRHFAVSW